MKEITRKKIRTVKADGATAFDRLFNETSGSLPSSAQLIWDGTMCVHFLYEETEKIPETARDEFILAGEIYHCIDCPHLEKTDDKRRKKFRCKYAEHLMAYVDDEACDVFYRELMRGGIHED